MLSSSNTYDLYQAMHALQQLGQSNNEAPEQRYPLRVAIIGAGPAGLSAATTLSDMGYRVTLFDALPVLGGMMAVGIPAIRLSKAQLENYIMALLNHNIEIRLTTQVGKHITFADVQKDFDAIILAIGLQQSQRCHTPGEDELEGVIPALTFLKHYNLDPFATHLRGNVAIIGGGIATFDTAYAALRAGANTVHLLYPGDFYHYDEWQREARKARLRGIVIHSRMVLKSILGTEDMNVHGIHCQCITHFGIDASGRHCLVSLPGSDILLHVDTVLVAEGELADLSLFNPDQIQLLMQSNLTNDQASLATAIPGLFLAGDIAGEPRTLLHAINLGRQAAAMVHYYLQKSYHRLAAAM